MRKVKDEEEAIKEEALKEEALKEEALKEMKGRIDAVEKKQNDYLSLHLEQLNKMFVKHFK